MEVLSHFLKGEINLATTLECGQAFRWRREGDGFCGVIGNRAVWLRQVQGGVQWKCSPHTHEAAFLADYLALNDPLKEIVASFPDDAHLREAARRYYGLRILRQDPWETLASFIASSAKQIAQIRQIVANLCESLGEGIHCDIPRSCHPEHSEGSPAHHGEEILRCAQNDNENIFYTFPTPDKVASASHETLWNCKLGFRAKYLHATARRIDAGELDLLALEKMETPRAREELMKCDGVGEKIANCTLLFGFGRQDAFPIDVWVERALRQLYFAKKRNVTAKRLREFSQSYFGPNAGYAQQYLFHYVRMNPEVLTTRQLRTT